MAGPLAGIRVLAMENFIAGPLATMWLADAGAEVVKVEPPLIGDQARNVPPMREKGDMRRSLSFLRANRNKRSIELDVKTDDGYAKFCELLKRADVFVENLRPSALSELRLTYADLSQLNQRLIYAGVSGFGLPEFNDGELPQQASFDIVAQAMGGLLFRAEGSNVRPVYAGFPLADIFASSNLQSAIYQALFNRERTGKGACIDIAMLDGAVALNELSLIMYSALGVIATPGLHGLTAPFGAYRASDGYVVIGVLGEPVWRRFTTAMGRPDLLTVPEYETGVLRHRNRVSLDKMISDWTATFTADELLKLLKSFDVPTSPVFNVDDTLEMNYLHERKMVVTVDDPVWGPTRMAGNPLNSSLMRSMPLDPAPHLGADNDAVFAEWLS